MKQILFISIIFALASCGSSSNKESTAVAKVYNDNLYKSDLAGLVPAGSSSKDSLSIVKNYINNWIEQKLLIHNAEENLSSKQKNFEKQLEDYKNSLLIFNYEKELVRQKLDTVVADSTIRNYYKKNTNEFLLKENIVKVRYVKLSANATNASTVKNLYKLETPSAKSALEEYCKKYAVNYYLDDSTWLFFNDLLKEIPIKTYDQEEYLKLHKNIELQDSLYSYYLTIRDYQVKESVSPLSFEKENVKKIILNKRKLKLIKDMQDHVFKEALKNKDFEIF